MKHDVFISYSRADSAIADRICEAFDKAGISYFIDLQGIGGGFEFPVVLDEAIVESKVVLFLASKSSYESKFTNAELTFAFNEKPKNSILPYIIDGSTMPPALRFVFSSINWRTIESHPIEPTLVDDILKMLGRDNESVLRAKAEEERKAKKKAAEEEARRKAEEQELKEQTRFWDEEIQREEKEKRLRYEQRQARIEKIKNIASIIMIIIAFSIGAVGIFVEAKRWWTERQEQQQSSTEQTTTDSLKIAQEQTETQRPANKQTTNQATPEKAKQEAEEKAAAERAAKEIAEAERVAKQEAEAQRLADEKAAADQAAKAKSEADRKAKEKAEAEQEAATKAEAERKVKEAATEKTYKIGDYYNDGTKEGVVFWVDETGKHGKIVSQQQSEELSWCTIKFNKLIAIGATSNTDGKANTDKAMARDDSRKYTAFVWCRNMGRDWYLPAIEELELLLLDDSVYDAVNKTLESRGAMKLLSRQVAWDSPVYWSSTEQNNNYYVICIDGAGRREGDDTSYGYGKGGSCYVRAVAQF